MTTVNKIQLYLSNIVKQVQTQRDYFFSNKSKRIIVAISAFFLLYLISYVVDPFSTYWEHYFDRPWKAICSDWLVTFLFCLGISEFSIVISNRLNKKIPWTQNPVKRLFLELGLNLIVVLVFITLLRLLYAFLANETDSLNNVSMSIEEKRGIIQMLLVVFFITFVIIVLNTGDYMIANWKNAALQASAMNQIAMEAELQSLRLQLDPHFVFNNLSVLSELILEDQQLGHDYAENFAKIYRYLLTHSQKNLVPLAEEIKFLNSYIFLLQQRIGKGIHFDMDIDNNYNDLMLPPLTLQLLVENALKHNKTVKTDPLLIKIYCTQKQELVVENTFKPLENSAISSGIGIRNIIHRYGLISGEKPQVYQDQNIFKVTVPLLNS